MSCPGHSPQQRVAGELAQRFADDHAGLRDDDAFWNRCHEQFDPELLPGPGVVLCDVVGDARTIDIGQSGKIML